MPVVSLFGIDDGALRAALADLIDEIGQLATADGSGERVDVALVLVAPGDDLESQLDAARSRHPGASVLVLLPFSQPAVVHRALMRGAAACHALDQPTSHLRSTMSALVSPKRATSVSGELT